MMNIPFETKKNITFILQTKMAYGNVGEDRNFLESL